MSDPFVSVLVTSFRPGGLDLTLAGMRDQKLKDFELIICDRRYEKRHNDVMDLAKKYGVKTIHVPEHRRNGKWTTFCSGWNTAMALARGEYVILLQDFAYAPPGWIEAHLECQMRGTRRYVVGPYKYTDLPAVKTKKEFDFASQIGSGGRCTEADAVIRGEILPEMYIFEKGPFDPAWIADIKVHEAPHQDPRRQISGGNSGTCPSSWCHVKNESCRRETLWEIGGLDERLERGKGPMDIDFGIRLLGADVTLWWEPKMPDCFCPNARWICRTMPWGDMEERLEGRWAYRDGLNYNALREKEIAAATDHFAESHAKNNYRMPELAARLASWRNEASHPVTPREAGDLEYWGREIWPETER